MSTTTGKTLNLVKPELTDDHKVTIGTDLPANFQKIDDAVSAHLADIATHGEILSLYRTNKDANGIYTALQWKRADGTLAKQSILSGGTSPKYTSRTVTYYDAAGTTVILTKTYIETYTGDDLTSEVLQ